MSYFTEFPDVEFKEFGLVKDITARVRIQSLTNAPLLDYDQEPGTRADVLASQYYGNPLADWLVYFANETIDPYAEQYRSDDQLNALIADKYGSVETAALKTKHFVNGWRGDDSVITTGSWAILPKVIQQLYDPVLNYQGGTTGFQRKQQDIYKSTSMYVRYTLAPHSFAVGDCVTLNTGGTGEVFTIVDKVVLLWHVVGDHVATTVGGVNVVSIDQVSKSITDEEIGYYDRVSLYDFEVAENEKRRSVKLVDRLYQPTAQRVLKELLS